MSWDKTHIDGRPHIHKEFRFKDFDQAFKFMIEVADHAQQANHHPTWRNSYDRVDIWLSTTDEGYTITNKDWDLALNIDLVYERYKLKKVDLTS